MDDADRVKDFLAGRALEQVALRTGAHGADDALVAIKSREHDRPHIRAARAEALQRCYTVHLRHRQVQQHHVRAQFSDKAHHLGASAGFGDDLEVRLSAEHRDEPITHDGMIVGDKDTNC